MRNFPRAPVSLLTRASFAVVMAFVSATMAFPDAPATARRFYDVIGNPP